MYNFQGRKTSCTYGQLFFFFLKFLNQVAVVLKIQLNDLIHHSI